MIELRKHLYESLLDDEEGLVNDDTTAILNDKHSIIYNHFKNVNKSWSPAIISNNEIFFDYDMKCDGTPISKYFDDIDTIKTPDRFTFKSNKELSQNTLCENLNILYGDMFIYNNGVIDNMNIEFENSGISIMITPTNNVKISNTTLSTKSNIMGDIQIMNGTDLPEFNNVKINSKSPITLEIYSDDFGYKKTGATLKVESILDPNYKITVVDKNGNTRVRKTDLKTTTTNLKKYFDYGDKLFKVKEGAKITDIIPNLPPDIVDIEIKDRITCEFYNLKYKGDYRNYGLHALYDFAQGKYMDAPNRVRLSDGWAMELRV